MYKMNGNNLWQQKQRKEENDWTCTDEDKIQWEKWLFYIWNIILHKPNGYHKTKIQSWNREHLKSKEMGKIIENHQTNGYIIRKF